MDDRDRFDEIDNMISSIEIIISDTTSKDIIEDLEEIKYKYYDEREELEQRVYEQELAEERQQQREYDSMRI